MKQKLHQLENIFNAILFIQKKTPHLHLEFFDNLQHLSITP